MHVPAIHPPVHSFVHRSSNHPHPQRPHTDVSITHLTFSKEFTKAIEQKQVAEQDAERQMYVVQRADQERKVRTRDRDRQTCVLA